MTTSDVDYGKIIYGIYLKYNRDKAKDVPDLLRKYKGSEDELLVSIFIKYGISKEEQEKLLNPEKYKTKSEFDTQYSNDNDGSNRGEYSKKILLIIVSIMVALACVLILYYYMIDGEQNKTATTQQTSTNETTNSPKTPIGTSSENTSPAPIAKFEKSQINLIGKQYLMKSDDFASFKYDKEYSENSVEYITIYKNYNPETGNQIHQITVKHTVSDDSIIIQVKAVFGGLFQPDDIYYRMKATSELKSTSPFGIDGIARAMGGNHFPHSVLVQFLNSNYSYVNLIEVCTHEGDGAEWYFLDRVKSQNNE